MTKLRQRLAIDDGFTLIELLVVIVIIGILLAIAVPSYLGFKGKASQKAADSDVRAALPSAEAYYSNQGSYQGIGLTALAAIDQGVKVDIAKPEGDSRTYCLQKTVGGKVASATRGFAPLSSGNVVEGTACL
jgi:prepilin-type N-terminal cleavage/methylation domain-containing protein